MLRSGALKHELLFVLLFVAILGGLVVLLTMRNETSVDPSLVRDELYGDMPKPKTTIAATPVSTEEAKPAYDEPLPQDIPKDQQKTVTTTSGLKIIDQRIGTGDKAKVGAKVGVIYTGTFQNGEKFDSNIGKSPYIVTVGAGGVIRGWDEGLVGMQKGGKRKLIIPYKLAYGEAGSPPKIPPRTDLIFELEVTSVKNK